MSIGNVATLSAGRSSSDWIEHARAVLTRHFSVPFRLLSLGTGEYYSERIGDASAAGGVEASPLFREFLQLDCWLQGVEVRDVAPGWQVLIIPLGAGPRPDLIAVGLFATDRDAPRQNLAEFGEWLDTDSAEGQVPYCESGLLKRLGEGALAAIGERRQLRTREADLTDLASQLTRNYEEITLLHQLTRDAQISQGILPYQELTLSLLTDLLPCPQIVYVDLTGETVLSRGEEILSATQCRDMLRMLRTRAPGNPLVDNRVSGCEWAGRFPRLGRLIAIPVVEGKEQFGWLLSLGTSETPELGSIEASLMTAVAAILATHQTNAKLFGNMKELFLGVVRAMTSAIDAKDPYTCGHSERVGWLARRIGTELNLPEDEQNRLYLAGLLHDVGKIGIRDSVLLKVGRLTTEEFDHIKEHPMIGYNILCGVKQLQPVLVGVRNHHENFDGTGYPDGLKEDGIPLMARILAVADCYDAMSTDRPYRKGMERDQMRKIFQEGSDKQWDSQIIQAFLPIQDQVHQKLSAMMAAVQAGKLSSDERQLAAAASHELDMIKDTRFISLCIT